MKKYFLILFIFAIIISCNTPKNPVSDKDNENPIDTFDCPLPYWMSEISDGPNVSVHRNPLLSPDGSKIVYGSSNASISILNLTSGELKRIDLNSLNHPSNITSIVPSNYRWCPYDNNRLLIHAVVGADTIGDGKRYHYAQRYFVISIDGNEFIDVTPSIYYTHFRGISSLGSLALWLKKSNPGEDYFVIRNSFKSAISIQSERLEYSPQNDTFSEYVQTSDSDRNLTYNQSTKEYFVNDKKIIFPESTELIYGPLWSPDKKFLVWLTWPSDDWFERLEELWVVDIDKFLNENLEVVPVNMINLRKNFCMFSGVYFTFISNSSIAIPLHKEEDNHAFLYEVRIDGKLIRQLTFEK